GERLIEPMGEEVRMGFVYRIGGPLVERLAGESGLVAGLFQYLPVLFAWPDENGRDWRVARVQVNWNAVLGVAPALGRGFGDVDAQGEAAQVVMLSERVFRSRFGADPAVLGRRIELDGKPLTVVGVMPRGFGFPDAAADAWVP